VTTKKKKKAHLHLKRAREKKRKKSWRTVLDANNVGGSDECIDTSKKKGGTGRKKAINKECRSSKKGKQKITGPFSGRGSLNCKKRNGEKKK